MSRQLERQAGKLRSDDPEATYQRAAEARPDEERRTEIATDQALLRLAKKVCPGCERPIDLTNPDANSVRIAGSAYSSGARPAITARAPSSGSVTPVGPERARWLQRSPDEVGDVGRSVRLGLSTWTPAVGLNRLDDLALHLGHHRLHPLLHTRQLDLSQLRLGCGEVLAGGRGVE